MVKKEPHIGWWIADIANLISISCGVIGVVCVLFVNHHGADLTAADAAFISQIGRCLGFLAVAWIAIGVVFATICRVGKGAANEAIAYAVLLVIAIVGVVAVLTNAPA